MLLQIQDFIMNHLMGAAGTVAIIMEFALRLFPTQKPASILHAISSTVHLLAGIFAGIGDFLDKILPQNLK